MSAFLYNASNLKAGGGLQVAQSICEQLHYIENHKFIVELSSAINVEGTSFANNAPVCRYDIKPLLSTTISGQQ